MVENTKNEVRNTLGRKISEIGKKNFWQTFFPLTDELIFGGKNEGYQRGLLRLTRGPCA